MPGVPHETILEVLREQPDLVGVLLASSGHPEAAGRKTVKLVDSDLSARRPLALHADTVFLLEGGKERLAVVVEAQTSPPRRDKRRSWAAYQAIAAVEHRCAALVWVFALSEATARSCRKPFQVGPGCEMAVAVAGPDLLATGPVAGLGAATWAVLAAAAGAVDLREHAGRVRVLDALATAGAGDLPPYNKLIMAVAPEEAVAALEELMAATYKETIVDRLLAQGEARGRAEGEAGLLLRVLAARGVKVTDEASDMVMRCTDTDQLVAWAERAATANTLSDVFGDSLPAGR